MDEALALNRHVADEAAVAREPFEALYVRHRSAVFRFVRARVATDEDAADLTAVAFERAFVAYAGYRPTGGGELAWLCRIARNAAIDEARRRRLAVEREPLARTARAEPDPASAVTASERAEEVRALLDVLSAEARDAVVLRYGVGLTAREIGDVLGRSEAATQKLISRALTTLKEAHRA